MTTPFKTQLKRVVCLLFTILSAQSAIAYQQDNELTAESILEHFVEVTGGTKAREGVVARESNGTIAYEFGGQKLDATFSIREMAPNLSRVEVDIPPIGIVINGFDGKQGWTTGGQTGDEVFETEQNSTAAVMAKFHGLAQWRDTFESIELGTSEEIDGSPAHRVNCSTDNGTSFTYFFDSKTGLLVKSLSPAPPQLPIDFIEVFHSDYREVDGIMYPFTVRNVARDLGGNGDMIQTYRYEEVKHADQVDQKQFAIPDELMESSKKEKAPASPASGESLTTEIQAELVETVADDIAAGSGGLCVNKKGVIFTSDFGSRLGGGGKGGDKIFRVSSDGQAVPFCNNQRGASGSTFADDGRLFQANIRGNVINVISPDGEITEFCSKGLVNPVGLAFDAEGNLLVCNCGNGSIQKISPDGKSETLAKDRMLSCPNGITLDENGNIYVSNFMNGDVVKITSDGAVSRLVTLPGNNNGHLVYHRGQLFVVARSAHQIYQVTLEGKSTLLAGNGERGYQDGVANEASFSYPNAIAVSPDGNSLIVNEVADTESDSLNLTPTRIRKINLNH